MKLQLILHIPHRQFSAAFGRLRVETSDLPADKVANPSAAFGRLRVETCLGFLAWRRFFSAAFGRLRVETKENRKPV